MVRSPLTILLGNPGSGKSTLAKDIAMARLARGEVAAFARLEDLASLPDIGVAAESETSAVAAVASAMSRITRVPVAGDVFTEARTELARGVDSESRVLIVLDGLDEIPTAAGRADVRRIVGVLVDCGYQVVMTSRVSGYSTPWPGALHAGVQPSSDPATARFALNWFQRSGDEAAEARFSHAAEDGRLSQVLSNPLTLGFACFVVHHGEVPMNAAGIFERFVDHFLRRRWHPIEHWVDDDAEIAEKLEAAADVAWAMARHEHGVHWLWKDSAVLAELEVEVQSARALYMTYDAGLLVPYGLLDEPTSRRFQRVRWMHRVVHEYLVASRLAQKLKSARDDWWPDLAGAILHPSWTETLQQLCQLLGDSPTLHEAIAKLQSVVEEGDVPDTDFAFSLAAMGRYCQCFGRRARLVETLANASFWAYAMRLDPDETVRYAIQLAGRHGDIDEFRSVLTSHGPYLALQPHHVDQLVEAGILVLSDPEQADVAWSTWLRCEPRETFPRELEMARTTGRFVGRLGFPHDAAPDVLRDLADDLVRHFKTGVSKVSASAIADLDDALADEFETLHGLPPRLQLVVEIRRARQETPDWPAIALLLGGDPHPRDVVALGRRCVAPQAGHRAVKRTVSFSPPETLPTFSTRSIPTDGRSDNSSNSATSRSASPRHSSMILWSDNRTRRAGSRR
jgi:hypothetical protein